MADFIAQLREETGDEYNEYSDTQIANAFHRKYQDDTGQEVEFNDFAAEMGFDTSAHDFGSPNLQSQELPDDGAPITAQDVAAPDGAQMGSVSPFRAEQIVPIEQGAMPVSEQLAPATQNLLPDTTQEQFVQHSAVGNLRTPGGDVLNQTPDIMEAMFDPWTEVGKKFIAQTPEAIEAAGGNVMAAAGTFIDELGFFKFDRDDPDLVTEAGKKISKSAHEEIQKIAPKLRKGSLKEYAFNVAIGTRDMGLAATASVLAKNPSLGLNIMMGQVYSSKFTEALNEGKSKERAMLDGAFYAMTEGWTEKIPLGVLTQEGGKFLNRTLKSMGAEFFQETFAEAADIAYKRGLWEEGEELTMGQMARRMWDAGLIGMGVGGSLAVITAPTIRSKGQILGQSLNELIESAEITTSDAEILQKFEPGNAQMMFEEAAKESAEMDKAEIVKDRRQDGREEDRRADIDHRRELAEMSEGEKQAEIEVLRKERVTNPLTGIKNKVAYEEDARMEHQAFFDLDDFKNVNTEMTHEGGDLVLIETAKVMKEVAGELGAAYHLSGDEFIIQSNDETVLNDISQKVQERLNEAEISITLPNGEVKTKIGIGASYGIAKTKAEADILQEKSKLERQAAGLRSGVRRDAGAVHEAVAEGKQDRVSETAAEKPVDVVEITQEEFEATKDKTRKRLTKGKFSPDESLVENMTKIQLGKLGKKPPEIKKPSIKATKQETVDKKPPSDKIKSSHGVNDKVWQEDNMPKVDRTKDLRVREARENIAKQKKALEQIFKDKKSGVFTAYSGIPVEAMTSFVKEAAIGLQDALGIPVKAGTVDITKPDAAKEPGLFNPILSPSTVANKYPIFKPYFAAAEEAMNTQERLREGFNKRLHKIEVILKRGNFKENKQILAEIRFSEDTLSEDFTPQQLKDDFNAPEEVILAHKLLRSAYNRVLHQANRARAERGKDPINSRKGYVPHFFHNWFIIVDGQILTSAKSLREAVSLGNKAARNGHEVKIRPKEFQFPDEVTQAAVIGDGQYFKLRRNLEKSFELTQEEASELVGGIVRMRGRSRFVGNFLQRKGVEGYEKNLDWIDRHYFNMMSRYIALDKFKSKTITRFQLVDKLGDFNGEHRGIAGYIKNYISDINGVPTAVEELINNSLANTPGLSKFLGVYLGSRPSLQIAGTITNAVAIAKLGLYNVSAAAVNATQFLNAQALIGARYTSIGVAKALAVDLEVGKRKLGFSPKVKRDIGILRKAGVDVQMGLESGAGYSRAAQMGRIFQATTLFFGGIERLLRQSTTLGAYYKAKTQGMSDTEALAYAVETNRRVNFDYSIADAPSFIRRSGAIGQVLFQFKKFPIKEMEFMASLKGAEHFKFWFPFLLLGGYFGLPGIDLLANLIRDLFDFDPELEMKRELTAWAGSDPARQRVAISIMYGIFGNKELGGLDLSHRVGGGDFIPSEIRDFSGAFFSSVTRATQLIAKEEWAEALRALATAPGNIAVALTNDGQLNSPWDRGRKVIDATVSDKVKKAFGFRTVKEAIETDITRIIKMEKRKNKDAFRRVIDDLLSGNQRKIQRGIRVSGEMGIEVTDYMLTNEAISKNISKVQRAILNMDTLTAGTTYKTIGFYEALKSRMLEKDNE